MPEPEATKRLSTGVVGLDEVLHGGLLPQRSYLVRGTAGTGKTTLGLHFLTAGAANGEKSLLITLGTPEARLRLDAETFGFDLTGIPIIDLTPAPDFFAKAKTYDIFSPADVEREPITQKITEQIEKREQARTMMDRQLTQIVRLVDDLLDVSRITRGKIELRKERVELAAVVASAVETSRPLIEAAGHELTLTLPPEPIPLDADLTRLAQVFSNLLNNAATYTEQGGHVWLTAERHGGEVVVKVRDTGLGIPAEMLSKIFEMFMQIDRSLERSHGGLGIGLTLVKRLLEMHGGSVEARSDGPGKGSEFTVRLPVAVVSASHQPPPLPNAVFWW
jgi:signal transduction histidine kinase